MRFERVVRSALKDFKASRRVQLIAVCKCLVSSCGEPLNRSCHHLTDYTLISSPISLIPSAMKH